MTLKEINDRIEAWIKNAADLLGEWWSVALNEYSAIFILVLVILCIAVTCVFFAWGIDWNAVGQ